jgi:hypothetical protein
MTKKELDQLPDRQPGEDLTQARRVEWPGASISLWPMRDGVCVGVSVGFQSTRRGAAVSGVVVDGIHEVVLTAPGGPDLHVLVSENFFWVDLSSAAAKLGAPGWETRVQKVRWTYGGEERSFDVGRLLHDVAPVPDVEPLPGSVSDPLRFTVAGIQYTAVGFKTAQGSVCARLAEAGVDTRPSTGCLSERLTRDALQRQPAHLFAGGGTRQGGLVRTGFARSDTVELTPAERAGDLTVILSEAWRPEPWEGEPIRFFFAFDPDELERGPRLPAFPLTARLTDGATVRVP